MRQVRQSSKYHPNAALMLWVCLISIIGCRGERGEEQENKAEAVAAQSPRQTTSVNLQSDQIERLGIATIPATAVTHNATHTVYGRVIPNPNTTYDVFAPYAGELIVDSKWPSLAATVTKGDVVGSLKVRVSPEIVADLRSRLKESEARLPSDLDAVESLSQIVKGLQPVANKQILSRTELDAAMANLAKAQAQVASDRSIVSSLASVLAEAEISEDTHSSHFRLPLVLSKSGQVTDLFVSTSCFVEAGQHLARIVDQSKQIVRFEIPLSNYSELEKTQNAITVTVGGSEVKGKYLGDTGEVSPSSQLRQYLFEFKDEGRSLRPGQVVQGRLDLGVQASDVQTNPALEIPSSALLYHQGLPLVFVKISDEAFQRRSVQVLSFAETKVVIRSASDTSRDLQIGVAEGESVVTSGTQMLLSRLFLQSGGDDD